MAYGGHIAKLQSYNKSSRQFFKDEVIEATESLFTSIVYEKFNELYGCEPDNKLFINHSPIIDSAFNCGIDDTNTIFDLRIGI